MNFVSPKFLRGSPLRGWLIPSLGAMAHEAIAANARNVIPLMNSPHNRRSRHLPTSTLLKCGGLSYVGLCSLDQAQHSRRAWPVLMSSLCSVNRKRRSRSQLAEIGQDILPASWVFPGLNWQREIGIQTRECYRAVGAKCRRTSTPSIWTASVRRPRLRACTPPL